MALHGRFRSLLLACTFSVLGAGAVRGQAAPESLPAPDLEKVRRRVAGEMKAARIPGLALAIVHRSRIVHLEGFGVTRCGGPPVTPQTVFDLGSVGKSFVALAVMQHVEAGRVDLDAPATRYLPWFRTADTDVSSRITIRHLLSHTSGLPTRAGLRDLERGDDERAVRALSRAALAASPGTAFEYSNANYGVLRLVVQAASGVPYDVYLSQNVLLPLGMRRSFASMPPGSEQDLATGHHYWFGRPRVIPGSPRRATARLATSMASCASDMARYLLAHMNGGRYEGAAVLSPRRVVELHTPQLGSQYAMGWFVTDWDGPRRIGHGGGTAGHTAFVAFEPAGGWGVVALMNGYAYFDNVRRYEVGRGVLDILNGRQPRPVPSDLPGAILSFALAALLALEAAVVVCLTRRRRPRVRAVRPRLALSLLALAWAGALLAAPRVLFGGSLHLTFLLQPDIALLLVLAAGAAVVGVVVGCLASV